jgi:hypothetical protein
LVRGKIICDSKSALNQSSKQYRRVSAGTPQADLFRPYDWYTKKYRVQSFNTNGWKATKTNASCGDA